MSDPRFKFISILILISIHFSIHLPLFLLLLT
jgi:hypothetical protein